MIVEEASINYGGLAALFLFLLLIAGIFVFVRHYKNNLDEMGKKKVKKIIKITAVAFAIILIAISVRNVLMYNYIKNQPADMIVCTQKSGMMMIDNYRYYKVKTKYGVKESIKESEYNELISLYGEREIYKEAKQKIISTNDKYNDKNIIKVFPYKDYIYYIFLDENEEVYTMRYNINTYEIEKIFFDYIYIKIQDLEGNVIISEYPDFCDSINEKLVNKLDEYIQTIYTDNRIVFEILVNNPKNGSYISLYEYIPETKETKLLVKFDVTNIREIAFIEANKNN